MTDSALSSPRFDLATAAGRRRAHRDLMWSDHGFLRVAFQNFHWISEEMARANQPSPRQIAGYAQLGFRTILNLRGASDTGYYALEREACLAHGIALVDAPLGSREPPSKERIFRARELFQIIEYPALMHCKSGADRAGIMGVFYKHFRLGQPIAEAIEQLRAKYLHVKAGKTGMLDFFFQTYLLETAKSGKSFLAWVEDDYDPVLVRRAFRASWWGSILTEGVLKRE